MHIDPLELFHDAVNAIDRQDWHAVAALCDAASLGEFRDDLFTLVTRRRTPEESFKAIDLMRTDPNMPRAVAEWQAQRVRDHQDPDRRLREELPSVESSERLEEMSPTEMFAAWLEGRSIGHLVERAFERRQITRAAIDEILGNEPPRTAYVALGWVPDGEAIGYVIYRQDIPGSRPQAAMVRRQSDATWLFVASRDLLMIDPMAAIRTEFTPKPELQR